MPVFRRSRRRGDVEARIQTVLVAMRPLLQVESFAVELVRYDPEARVAHLRIGGGCPDCDMTAVTLTRAIEAHLRRRVPEVETVAADVALGE